MDRLVARYAAKIAAAGLAAAEDILLAGLDDAAYWNADHPDRAVLEPVLDGLSASALACVRPGEPYRTIFEYLAARHPGGITPGDCETRLFLHDLPVVRDFAAPEILAALSRRKGAVLPGPRLVASGTAGPEQAFVTLSSLCFAGFVLFFTEYLADLRAGRATQEQRAAFTRAAGLLAPVRRDPPSLAHGPFRSPAQVHEALVEAGRATVDCGLVDSFFGNISALLDGIVYISQTGSSLDELPGCLDACPLDGSTCAGLTASSELTAHAGVYAADPEVRCILHGHPKFTVILSLDCADQDCAVRGNCATRCTGRRFAGDIPIVPGEVGTGPFGLCHTLPRAAAGGRGAIVLGHGLFALGRADFNEAFGTLLQVENACREECLRRVRELGG